MDAPSTPIDSAAKACGGFSKLAEKINAGSVQAVMNWRTRGIPVEQCPAVERATREAGSPVPCEELRPDLTWRRVRDASWPWRGGKPLLDVAPESPTEAAA